MSLLFFLHLLFLGVWLGCVSVEAVLEISAKNNAAQRPFVARLHYWIDILVEIPAFSTVLVTGLLMLDLSKLSPLYVTKIAFGLVPLIANALCVIPVVRRKHAADSGDNAAIDRNSRQIFWAFAGAPFGFVALGIGLSRLGIL